jgi:hypothetical protein
MAKARTDASRAADVIKNWLRSRTTLEFLGTWEVMYNPGFKIGTEGRPFSFRENPSLTATYLKAQKKEQPSVKLLRIVITLERRDGLFCSIERIHFTIIFTGAGISVMERRDDPFRSA